MTGQLIIAIDPSAFSGGLARFAVMARMIEEQAGARLPGRRRITLRAKSEREGLTVSDALLKIGYCRYEMKLWDPAKAALEQVVNQYPDAPAAKLARERLDKMAAEKH